MGGSMMDQFDGDAFNNNLDDFDDWFGSIHENSMAAFSGDDESDEDDNGESERKKRTRARKTRKHQGAVDRLSSGQSLMDSSTRERAVKARERAQRAQSEKQKQADKSSSRRQRTRESLNQFLDAIDEDTVPYSPEGAHSGRRRQGRSSGDMKSPSGSSRNRSPRAGRDGVRSSRGRRGRSSEELGSSHHSTDFSGSSRETPPTSPETASTRRSDQKRRSDNKATLKILSPSPGNDQSVIIELDKETLALMLDKAGLDEKSFGEESMESSRRSDNEKSRHSRQSERSRTSRHSDRHRISRQSERSRQGRETRPHKSHSTGSSRSHQSSLPPRRPASSQSAPSTERRPMMRREGSARAITSNEELATKMSGLKF